MNLTHTEIEGAQDKRFQDKYNYLVRLLSKTLSGIDTTVVIKAVAPQTVDGSMVFVNGILKEYTPPT